VILLLASNHWARDSLGALEVPLEDAAGPFALTVVQYNALTTGYFVPNIFVPLLAGGFAQRFGAANAIVLFCFFAALGNGLVALSAVVWSYPLLFTGRACMGLA
jgi:MFS family permease